MLKISCMFLEERNTMATKLVSAFPCKIKSNRLLRPKNHPLIELWYTPINLFLLGHLPYLSWSEFYSALIQRPLKGWGFFLYGLCFINITFLKNYYETTYLNDVHSRTSVCICHFFDVANVIIELEQIRGHNQEVGKTSPWSEFLTVYAPHAVQNGICVKLKATKVQLLSTETAKR